MQMTQLKEFVALHERKRELDAELKKVSKQLDDLEEILVPQFITDGVQSMNVDGRTVYIQKEVYAGPLNGRDEVIEALKSSDLGQYVAENYNAQSLKAYVREIAKEVELVCGREQQLYDEQAVLAALPPALAAAVKVSFVHSLRSRKA